MKKKLPKSLALIGFQACGKTTLGELLAQSLDCSFMDSDRLIENFHPSFSCQHIFQTFGAAYFRVLEKQAIGSVQYHPPLILATGGGSLLQSNNVNILKAETILIYLKTSPEILKRRIWQRQTLPAYLNSKDPDQAFISLYHERMIIYEKWSDYQLEMDNLTIQNALQQLLRLIEHLMIDA